MNNPYSSNEPDEPVKRPDEFLAAVPPGDHPAVAEHLANSAVAHIASALADILGMVDVHEDLAPVSAGRVLNLTNIVAKATLEWIRQWPK